jgi:hypothetical protein
MVTLMDPPGQEKAAAALLWLIAARGESKPGVASTSYLKKKTGNANFNLNLSIGKCNYEGKT